MATTAGSTVWSAPLGGHEGYHSVMTSPRTCLVLSLLLTACGLPATPERSAQAPAVEAARVPAPSVMPPKAEASPKLAAPPKVATPPKASTPPKAPTPAKAAPVAARPAAPTLDLKSLEQRLKETSAVGVLTKLSLKNQVDDLVGRFRAFHGGQRPPTLGDLRPSFDLLLMKVLSLLQDKDAALAKDIDASRNSLWEVLTDRDKLAQST